MPIKILMPALSPTMEHGNLAKWLKKEGDQVKAGEVIAEIETDKATMEVEAVDEGILAKIMIPEGTNDVSVNSLIAILLEEGEEGVDLKAFIENNSASKKVPATKNQDIKEEIKDLKNEIQVPKAQLNNDDASNRIFASPLAKRIAQATNLDLSIIKGSGPHGRIVKADVISSKATIKKSSETIRNEVLYQSAPNNNMRKIIAQRLLESKQQIPHFYLSMECMMDNLLSMREQINDKYGADKTRKISVNDLMIMASAKALKECPKINSSWSEEETLLYNNVDISVAVATEDGLFTPIIKSADIKNIFEISAEMKYLADKARKKQLKPEEYIGGGFSISNLGMFGIKSFNAIINPPQSCILAIGASEKKPVVISDKIEIKTILNLSISCDHRVVDGLEGAKFLNVLRKYIEAPILLFVE